MLNHAIRYRPIVAALERQRPARVLEVGSGPEGLAMFWRGVVVGVDVGFKRKPLHHAVSASAVALPFPYQSWPVVVSCDMLEHIPPGLRHAAIVELTRVTGKTLYLAFPSGKDAWATYQRLAQALRGRIPPWLAEHLRYGLPEADEVIKWFEDMGWHTDVTWYESAAMHFRLMYMEAGWIKYVTYGAARALGPWLLRLLPHPSLSPEPDGHLRVLIEARRVR